LVAEWKREFPYPVGGGPGIKPQWAIRRLSEMTNGEAIISLGVGQHQMWAMQHYKSRHPRSFLSSSGFGTMGYGLPAAIGAKTGCPARQVIDIDGDGSLNMTIHELATCHRFGIGVKVVVINNQWLGMVRQWQDMIYSRHRSGSGMSDPMVVKRAGEEDIYPDFLKIAEGYRVAAERVTDEAELPAAFARMLADADEPYLVDVIVAAEENVYPMIPAGGTCDNIIMSERDLAAVSRSSQGSNI
jgi:acetolactate synthase-1/2/3 large subunit